MQKIIVLAMVGVLAAPAIAAFTSVNVGNGNGSEPSGWGVLDKLLDGSLDGDITAAQFNSGSFAVAGVSRLHDSGASLVDRTFQDGTVQVNLQALFFGNPDINNPGGGQKHSLSIGFENGNNAGTVQNLIGHNSPVGSSASFMLTPGEYFSFFSVRGATPSTGDSIAQWDGNANNKREYAWSTPHRNNTVSWNGSQDRMVTLAIDPSVIGTLYALDGSGTIDISSFDYAMIHYFDTGSDGDYQDAIWLSLGAKPVPAPAAAVLAALGLGVASIKRRLS
jgi:hypothetical protein